MDCTAIILTIGIIFAASFFSTVSGFGFALVAMPVLTLVMSVKAAVIFAVAHLRHQQALGVIGAGGSARRL